MNRRKFLEYTSGIIFMLYNEKMCKADNNIENSCFTLIDSIQTDSSPKSIEFDPNMSKAYINNLEACNIWIIDAKTHSLERIINYKKTPTTKTKGNYSSFEEKPVETCFTHNGRRFWTSLHNSFGITVQDFQGDYLILKYQTKIKQITIEDKINNKIKKMEIPFIKTGMTPKILRSTPNQKRVCVANWHSATVSVIDSETGENYGDINVGSVPRGIAYTSDSRTGFVANFCGNSLSIFSPYEIKRIEDIKNIGLNPRHVIIDQNDEFLYVSFHGDGYLRRINVKTKKVQDELYIGGQIRSIAPTPNFEYIFADSFNQNKVVLIDTKTMKIKEKVTSLYHPVGIAYNHLNNELWVVNQGNSRLNIFKFE